MRVHELWEILMERQKQRNVLVFLLEVVEEEQKGKQRRL